MRHLLLWQISAAILNWINAHPVQATLVAKAAWDSVIGALPSPTKDSSTFYVFLFKLLNGLAFNFHRAKDTSVENSPNFIPAVEGYIARMSPDDLHKLLHAAGVPNVLPPS